jgi:hypothetical protein
MAFQVNDNECKAGGIIAYTKKNDRIYFLMINNSKKDKNFEKVINYYEDPGGKFEKSDYNLVYGMCREFEEETSLSYYQYNNDIKINIVENTGNLINKSSLEMSENIKNKIKLLFLPKSKYALGFLEVSPNFMDLKIKKYETLSLKEKKENRSLEWIKSDKFLYKKLHPRLFYNKNLIIDFLRDNNLINETSPVSSPTRKSYSRRNSSSSVDSTPISSPTRKLIRRNSEVFYEENSSSSENSPTTSPLGESLHFVRRTRNNSIIEMNSFR